MALQTIVDAFLAGLGIYTEISIICGGNEFAVDVVHVESQTNGIQYEYQLVNDSWSAFCYEKNLAYGDVVVFTKLTNIRYNLMAFNADGSGKTNLQFLGATTLNLNQPQLDYALQSEFLINVSFKYP